MPHISDNNFSIAVLLYNVWVTIPLDGSGEDAGDQSA